MARAVGKTDAEANRTEYERHAGIGYLAHSIFGNWSAMAIEIFSHKVHFFHSPLAYGSTRLMATRFIRNSDWSAMVLDCFKNEF
jgi:hypothetical protein